MMPDAVKILTLGVWMLILTACNDLSIFVLKSAPPSLDQVTSVALNDQGYLELKWRAKDNSPVSTYEIYLRELDTEDERYAFTSLSVVTQPLRSEQQDIPKSDSPRKSGELISATNNFIYTFDKVLDPSKKYLVQISEKGRIRPATSERAILLKVEFEKFSAASAVRPPFASMTDSGT